MRNLTHLLSAAVIACTAVSASSNVMAGDDKVFSGNGCRSYWGGQESRLAHLARYTSNTSSATTWVSCPLVRDNTLNTNGTKEVLVRVYRDGPASGSRKLFCELVSGNGYTGFVSDTASYLGHGNHQMQLDVNKSWKRGQYSIRCNLPRNGRIYSIVTREF